MSAKNNSASRLLDIFNRCTQITNSTGVYAGWSEIFGVDDHDVNNGYVTVTNKLGLMHLQIRLIKDHLKQVDFSPDVFLPTLRKAEVAISPQILHAQWNSVRQHLSPDTLTSLAFCSQILPDEESMISAEAFEDIMKSISDLEDLLVDSDLPSSLLLLIRQHVELIKDAIANYPITGASGLRTAAKNAIGDFVVAGEEIQENGDKPAVKKFSKVWGTFNKLADGALKTEKLTLLGVRAAKLLEHLF